MKYKKIRGSKRRSKQIEKWRRSNLALDLSQIKTKGYNYVKVWVNPWQNLRYINRNYIGPNKTVRDQILNAFLDIYESWDEQLKIIGEPYYLKIWLFDPRFSSSEVVCAIGERMKYFDSLFYFDMKKKEFSSDKFLKVERISQFNFQP